MKVDSSEPQAVEGKKKRGSRGGQHRRGGRKQRERRLQLAGAEDSSDDDDGVAADMPPPPAQVVVCVNCQRFVPLVEAHVRLFRHGYVHNNVELFSYQSFCLTCLQLHASAASPPTPTPEALEANVPTPKASANE